MIVLFTDYGLQGPYIGQVEAVIHEQAPAEKIINLFSNAPRNNPKSSAYLLAAYCRTFVANTVFFCVVDPGVGKFADPPVILKMNNSWFVGPNNGLFDIVARRAEKISCREILWRPEKLSNSFHGRDLYAPVCAMLANGEQPEGREFVWIDNHRWPDDLYEVVYIDHFGNCITGVRASDISADTRLRVANRQIDPAITFSDAPEDAVFWYENANGLVEIAKNQGNAAVHLNLEIGSEINTI